MEPITKQEAKRANLKYYFTGKPCPKGHITKRKVHNGTCYECAQAARTARESIDEGKHRTRPKLRKQILDKFGNACNRCGFSDPRALQIDHVNGGGAQEIRNTEAVKYYKAVLADQTGKYQLLCANCNWIKRSENRECFRSSNLGNPD